MNHHLVWFRSDLRLRDNPALAVACHERDTKVSAIYVDCPQQWIEHGRSAIQRDFLQRNLQALAGELAARGIPFTVLTANTFADAPALLKQWAEKHRATTLFANRESGIDEWRRDDACAAALKIPSRFFSANCLFPEGTIKTQQGEMYQVFTPFANAWRKRLMEEGYRVLPLPKKRGEPCRATKVKLGGEMRDSGAWAAGESAALKKLQNFAQQKAMSYGELRDLPAVDGTSQLGPYLTLGIISAGQCLAALEKQLGKLPYKSEAGFSWLNELIWREFYRHLMAAFPRISMNGCFKVETEAVRWRKVPQEFERWCQGQTGFPIVDAAMRCLNETGWMHNRLRMICASFLCKDLHISWREGETYFMAQLIDGDFASNNGGWQWCASTGADAAPYFRVFNPTTQGKKFDPKGEFIRRWVEELAEVPDKHIHTPHLWLAQQPLQNPYPEPMVDHKQARIGAITLFEAIKNK